MKDGAALRISGHPRPAVISPGQGSWVDDGRAEVRVAIDRSSVGCRNLVQRLYRYRPGAGHAMHNQISEDVMYVMAGSGEAKIGDTSIALRPGLGVLVPPDTAYRIANTGVGLLELVSVLSPQPDAPEWVAAAPQTAPPTELSVHESDQEVIPAGDDEARHLMDRYFRLMIDPRYGCRYLTQFVGFIENSKAPVHTHTYEEVLYILGGSGTVHLEDGEHTVGPNSSVYLPPGSAHCLENRGEQPLSLLGVFCPAGSPGARQQA